jgi:hypothetical protein
VVTGNLTLDGRPNRFSNGKLISMPTLGEAYATGVEGEGAAALRPYNTRISLERKIITVRDLYILPNRQAS